MPHFWLSFKCHLSSPFKEGVFNVIYLLRIFFSPLYILPPKVHWFSIINSLLIVVFLAALVGMILLRAVYGDISRYNQRSDEVKGWYLFRSLDLNLLLESVFPCATHSLIWHLSDARRCFSSHSSPD